MNSGGLAGRSSSSGSASSSSTRSLTTRGMSTFCWWVRRTSPLPYARASPHDLEQLLGAQPADRHQEPDRGVPPVELRRHADVVVPLQVGRGRHAAGQLAAQAALELLAVGLGADRVHQELQPRAAPLGAVLLGVAEDRRDAGDDLRGLVGRHEYVEPACEVR